MWSRVVEVMLGCWLAVSPFVFRHGGDDTAFWVNDLSCASAVILLALVSWWHPLRHAHVLIAGVGLWMIAFGYLHFGGPIPPAVQNNVLMGLLLVMFGVIPNRASEPPASWRKDEPRRAEPQTSKQVRQPPEWVTSARQASRR